MLTAAKSRAENKGITFSLTEEWALARWTGKCELTDIPFVLGLRGCSGKIYSPSIDKIDPKKGYTPENCRFVIFMVNIFKYTATDEEMYDVAEKLLSFRNAGNQTLP